MVLRRWAMTNTVLPFIILSIASWTSISDSVSSWEVASSSIRMGGSLNTALAIARAVFKDPPILILDEATSQLDTESEMLVQEAIDRMMKGRTVFVIAHRLSTIKHASTIYVLDAGRIVDSGSHEEQLQKVGLYKRLYEMQFKDNLLK